MPGTWSGGRQLTSSARTPRSSKWRAARPNSSPSGPPQCWPKTPQTPCRQRRKLTHTGIPLCTIASAAGKVRPSRTSVIVSSRTRSGGSSSKTRGSSSSISRREALSTSPLMLDASAAAPARPACSIASRPTRSPRRATSIQCTGVENAARRSSSPVRPQVFVEITSQPTSRYARCTSRTASGWWTSAQVPHSASSSRGVASGRRRPSSVAMPPSMMTQRCACSSSSMRPYVVIVAGPSESAMSSIMGKVYPAPHPPTEGSCLLPRGGSGQGTRRVALPLAQRQSQVARRRLGPVGRVELAQDVLDVELDGALGDDERPGDVGVRLPLDHVLEHVVLATGQEIAQRRVAAAPAARRLVAAGGVALDGEIDRAVGQLARAGVGPARDLAQLLALDAQPPAQDGALEDVGEGG